LLAISVMLVAVYGSMVWTLPLSCEISGEHSLLQWQLCATSWWQYKLIYIFSWWKV